MVNRATKRFADRETTLTQEKQKLKTSNTELTTQLNELKTTNATLNTQLEELIAIIASTDKKQTAKELKALKEQARQQMIVVNNLFCEDKLFTKEDYAAIRALGADNLEKGAKEIASKVLDCFDRMLAHKEDKLWLSKDNMRLFLESLQENKITRLTQQLETPNKSSPLLKQPMLT
ncbi:hypothetical protein [Helicobacter heilmannii]|uniref:hypothetical protein n=1 Tax=Helicobacter heilmannii TaxID=35817 RepID=UPI000CF14889|nr:hypothetical protein [Helicobacter heilmannii]GMB95382.1 hypothetical protein NHP21011_14880 [Helicobacter heilmannii]